MENGGTLLGDQGIQAHREAILEELDRILKSRFFKHSKRCGPLLRYVVIETLEGRREGLKERVIGVDVFGRKINYDTAADPIVRATASEVRKRLALYYHELGHIPKVQIDLASGSYVPEIRLMDGISTAPAAAEVVEAPGLAQQEIPLLGALGSQEKLAPTATIAGSRYNKSSLYWPALAIVLLAALGLSWWAYRRYSSDVQGPVERFWRPFWGARPAIIAAGGGNLAEPAEQPEKPPQTAMEALLADRVGFADAAVLAEIVGLFRARGKQLSVRRGRTLTLEEMRRSPVILVGLGNPWTMRLSSHLRYYVQYEEYPVLSIRDRQKPEPALFRMSLGTTIAGHTAAYAVISRYTDRLTEQPVLMLTGLGREGTMAAAEFATDAKHLRALEQRAPKGWEKRNMQVIISTDVVDENYGPPRIEAVHVW